MKHGRNITEVQGRFATLEEGNDIDFKVIDDACKLIYDVYKEAAGKVIGTKRAKNKLWISTQTWNLNEDKKKLKHKMQCV